MEKANHIMLNQLDVLTYELYQEFTCLKQIEKSLLVEITVKQRSVRNYDDSHIPAQMLFIGHCKLNIGC